MHKNLRKPITKGIVVALVCIMLAVVLLPPLFARADEGRKKVKVGWYETPFNTIDGNGRRSGYAYEYQRKIAAYTGWEYEYVEGTWSELFQKLENGEIDLMSDISYTEERAEKISYASVPMGTEKYFLYVTTDNTEITPDKISTINGKRVGVTKGTVQQRYFETWARRYGIRSEIVELDGNETESIDALRAGEVDAYITLDAYYDPERLSPVCQIGASDFYFAVSKDRSDLLQELNSAMSKIQDENHFYNQELYEKYLKSSGKNIFLSAEEKSWLSKHGAIRVGYQDNYMAFCAKDENTRELTGALKDFLDHASASAGNAKITFAPIAYNTVSDALSAMDKGEVDCVFPANFTAYDGETIGIVMTQPLMNSEMVAVVKESEIHSFVQKESVTVAINEGNINYERFLDDHFPTWARAVYPDTSEGLKAVAAGDADCVLISTYRFNNISKQCEKLKLSTVSTGVAMDYSFAVKEGNKVLYSILSKVAGAVPKSTVSAALTYYSVEDAKLSFWDYVKSHLAVILAVLSFVILGICVLIWRSIHLEKKTHLEHHLVNDLSRRVNYDALTSVRNKGAFKEYIFGIQERLDKGENVEFAVGMLDCNDLKKINDVHGHDKGDEYLKATCRLICRVFRHSAVFRIGGDEFAVVMMGEDYQNREAIVKRFEEEQEMVCRDFKYDWEKIRVAYGIVAYDPDLDHSSAEATMNRADQVMYENKKRMKVGRDFDPAYQKEG